MHDNDLHDDLETLAFLAQKVLNRDLDILKGDVTSAGGNGIRGFDRLNFQAFRLLDQKHGDTLGGTDGNAEVVSEDG
jgi:hypothetical protein